MSRHPTSLTKGLSLLRSPLEAATARVPGIVECHDGDAYDKSFKSWEHLVTLIYAQLSGTDSLRGIETGFNADAHHHYHLGVSAVARSTLSDANAGRPVAVFAQTFTMLAQQAGRNKRRPRQPHQNAGAAPRRTH
jgi:putative transposase